jgi:uncharacterized protein (TIGR00269 family)
VRCSACERDAIVDRPYHGDHVCSVHLAASVEERFRREMHDQLPRFPGGTVAVALSGGKDSSVALALAAAYFGRRPTAKVVALSVDEGIAGYRAATLAKASELATQLGVEHRVVSAARELGTTTDARARTLPGVPPCSYCGVWRRGLLNRAARDAGADVLVLGFNLDDLAQTVLMNLVHGDLDRLVRMAPHRQRQPGLVPRIAPLASVPEREVFLYAHSRGLPFGHDECPHASAAARNRFREIVWQLEDAQPGTRQSLLRTHRRLVDLWLATSSTGAPGTCRVCGEPSATDVCRSCTFLQLATPTGGTSA